MGATDYDGCLCWCKVRLRLLSQLSRTDRTVLKTAVTWICLRAIAKLSKQTDNPVNLTTIHGAKGLEANRVIHLKPNLVPHPRAEKD